MDARASSSSAILALSLLRSSLKIREMKGEGRSDR